MSINSPRPKLQELKTPTWMKNPLRIESLTKHATPVTTSCQRLGGDFVAIKSWTTAVERLCLLSPNISKTL